MSEWVVFLHVVIAFWFVAGLIGRDVALGRARSRPDIRVVRELADLAGRFERLMVIPGSAAVLLAGLLAAFAEGRSLVGTGNWWLLVSIVLYLSTAPLVPLVFLPRGKVFARALQDSEARSQVTPALAAAFNDRAVAAARLYEKAAIVGVILLMVVKPF
jgi:hypothetical protein